LEILMLDDLGGFEIVGVAANGGEAVEQSQSLVFAAIRAGARGYLMKDADDLDIARVLHGIARGEATFGPGTAQRLLDAVNRIGHRQEARAAFPHLTTRELEVLERVARGRRNGEIAAELLLSERTVRNYISTILSKLEVADRSPAIARARDAGLGRPPSESP
jgi:DNA-binding NarL/FixJ family response regulator